MNGLTTRSHHCEQVMAPKKRCRWLGLLQELRQHIPCLAAPPPPRASRTTRRRMTVQAAAQLSSRAHSSPLQWRPQPPAPGGSCPPPTPHLVTSCTWYSTNAGWE